jgi:chloride channel protein, CIC family
MEKLKGLKGILSRVDSRTIYLYAFFTGVLTGGVALLFHFAIHGLSHLLFDDWAHFPLPEASPITSLFTGSFRPAYLLVLLIPTFGGLLVGICIHFFGQEATGTGVDQLLDSFHNHGGIVRKRAPFVKFLTSILTLSTGGSAGKEGPMAFIGAGVGSLCGRLIKMGARAQRTLLLAGAAGGLGAIFRAPLGGALTAVEVLYKEDFEADALIPCIISSVTAYSIFSSVVGFGHVLQFQTQVFHSPIELLFYVPLGLFCSFAGYLFVRLFKATRENFFLKLPLPKILLPAVGGLFIGIIGLIFPPAIGQGLSVIQGVIDGNYPQYWVTGSLLLLFLAITKMLATSLTIQSGGSGGALIPSLFIGAMLGGFFGTIVHHFFPNVAPSVTPYVVVGMAAFFSSVTNASLAALVMVTEFTGGYELLPPLMTVAVISLITSHKWSIYRKQVTNKFSSKAHLWDMNPRNLQHVKIGDAFSHRYLSEAVIMNNQKMVEIEKITQQTQEADFVVQNSSRELIGLISLKDLSAMRDELEHTKGFLVAEDLLSRKPYYVSEEDSLYEAMRFLTDFDFDKVPVVKKEGAKHYLLGYLRYQDVLQYYYRLGIQPGKE